MRGERKGREGKREREREGEGKATLEPDQGSSSTH